MDADEIQAVLATQAATRAFAATPAGGAMRAFEALLTTAVMAEAHPYPSALKLRTVWDKADAARATLRAEIEKLQNANAATGIA